MKQLAAGICIGAIVGGGGAIAAVRTLIVPAGATAQVRPGRPGAATVLRFPEVDLRCFYFRTNAPPPETGVEPLVWCGRSAKLRQSRTVIISPYRVFVVNAAGKLTYTATRTP